MRATIAETDNYAGTTATADFTITKADIDPAVSLEGWTYGEDANEPSVTGNAGEGAVTYEYKAKDADDSAYSETVPSAAGEYTVRATIAETDNYAGATATADFTISVVLESIKVTTDPTKTSYKEGELFDPTGMVVTAIYNDGSTKDITNDVTISPDGALSKSDKVITIRYSEDGGDPLETTTPITVTASSSGGGGSGGGGGGSSPKPDEPVLTGEDHSAYIAGYPDGTVHPNGSITRAESVTIIYRLLPDGRRAEIFSTSSPFSDVTGDLWYNEPVSSLAKGGYVLGYPDGTFGGDRSITRAEFAAMLVRLMGASGGSASFPDVDSGHWACGSIATAASQGWLEGYPDGTFRPDQPITRAEAITVINRILNRGVDENSTLGDYKNFSDNSDPGAWYYYEILEAANDHEYIGTRPHENWIASKLNSIADEDSAADDVSGEVDAAAAETP